MINLKTGQILLVLCLGISTILGGCSPTDNTISDVSNIVKSLNSAYTICYENDDNREQYKIRTKQKQKLALFMNRRLLQREGINMIIPQLLFQLLTAVRYQVQKLFPEVHRLRYMGQPL